MTALEEKLVEYIDDAYAMEQNVLRMLDGMIGTTKDPQMKRSLERHKKQTEQQAERLEECLREHGA
jgi:ferritin-like metal-binding protein YciE